jgi:hypothetical protein
VYVMCDMDKTSYKLFSEQFMCEFPLHDLWIMKAFRVVSSSRWEKRVLGHFHVLQEML